MELFIIIIQKAKFPIYMLKNQCVWRKFDPLLTQFWRKFEDKQLFSQKIMTRNSHYSQVAPKDSYISTIPSTKNLPSSI